MVVGGRRIEDGSVVKREGASSDCEEREIDEVLDRTGSQDPWLLKLFFLNKFSTDVLWWLGRE